MIGDDSASRRRPRRAPPSAPARRAGPRRAARPASLAGCSGTSGTDGGIADLAMPASALPDLLACQRCSGDNSVCDPSTFDCVACLKDTDCSQGFSCMRRSAWPCA